MTDRERIDAALIADAADASLHRDFLDGDRDAILERADRVLAAEYRLVNPLGVQSRDETLAFLAHGTRGFSQFERTVDEAYLTGGVVVVVGLELVVVRDFGAVDGGPPMRRRFVNCWRCVDGTWQQVLRSTTALEPVD